MRNSDKYETPPEVFKLLSDRHGPFDLDVCAEKKTAKCDVYFDRRATEQRWEEFGIRAWCNPPYSNPMPWVKKAIEEMENGVTTVMLLPADNSTKWFRLLRHQYSVIYYDWPGRITFLFKGKKVKWPAKFGSFVVIFMGKKL